MSGNHTHDSSVREIEEKPKTSINRKEAFHNALRGVEIGITAGSVLGAAIAFGMSATMLPTIALVASFAVIGAAVAVEGNPFVFLHECCTKGLKSVGKLIKRHGQHEQQHNVTPEQQEIPQPQAAKRTIQFESQETDQPSVSFQRKLMEQSHTQAQGRGL